MNNSKLILFLSCLAALTLTAPLVTAAPRGSAGHSSGGPRFASMSARGGQTFTRSGAGNFRTFNDRREDRFESRHPSFNDRREDRLEARRFVNNRFVNNRFVNNRFVNNRFVNNRSRVVFIGSFGFPGWWGWGWGWGWGYPYGYYGYGYPYGYGYWYPYGDGYGYQSGYDSNDYGSSGGGGTASGSDYPTHSRVAELQRRLARAGYYHGAIDGILGTRTREAIRAYERDHGYAG